MTLWRTLSRTAGLVLCTVVFAGPAVAGPGNGNGNDGSPGNSANAPGQVKKEEPAAPASAPSTAAPALQPSAAPAVETKAAKQEAKAAAKAEKSASRDRAKATKAAAKATVKATTTATSHGRSAEAKAAAKSAAKTESHGRSALAHHHVVVCHRTGSDKNPYVVINIPMTAWTAAHSHVTGAHPDKNGRHDILLKDPASRPGSKDGFDKSDCGAPAAVTPKVDVKPQTHLQPQAQILSGLLPTPPAAAPAARPAVAAPAAAPQAQAAQTTEVAGVTNVAAPAPAKAKAPARERAQGGVLGAVASAPKAVARTATRGTLPFTGVPLWLVALVGGGLLAGGLVLRRA